MNKLFLASSIALSSLALVACGGSSGGNTNDNSTSEGTPTTPTTPTIPTTPTDTSENGISRTIPSNLGSVYNSKNFNRYTKVVAPNGGSIHIVAQDKLTDEQILKARNVLEFYLTDYAGSLYGADKSAVANKMADNKAILVLLNGQDDGMNPLSTEVTGQPLYQNEIQVEGGKWYMAQNYEHRDASYEEILHMVHDTGIGVDGVGGMAGALPAYQQEIRTAQKNALSKDLWGRGAENKGWIKELTKENSLSQEYLASVVDSYYGLWGAHSGTGGMRGVYIAKTRDDVKAKDPMGYALMGKFLHPYITYNAQISASLNGNFSLRFDPSKPYTNHSRYLKDVTLLGTNNNSVTVNELDNNITGNSGINTVIFSGNSNEYAISMTDGKTIVTDLAKCQANAKCHRDGTNTLINVEKLQFKDKTQTL